MTRTREEILASIAQKQSKFKSPTNQGVGMKEGITRAVGQGLSFGFGDEIEAFIRIEIQS